jgi:hypothetical protein
MACTEFQAAIDWIRQSHVINAAGDVENHPVMLYFTMHFGNPAVLDGPDHIHFATQFAVLKDSPTPHLSASDMPTLFNSDTISPGMVKSTTITYDIEVFPEGTISYLMKLNGKPVGAMLPTKVSATCVDGRLLTFAGGGSVITVGVARQKPVISHPV